MELSPRFVEQLVFGFGAQRRHTQDSPVLPDVWAFYATPSEEARRWGRRDAATGTAKDGGEKPLELLLTPHRAAGPAALAREVRERLTKVRESRPERPRRLMIAYTQSYVVVPLYFDEVIQVLLPLTPWWRTFVWRGMFRDEDADGTDDRTLRDLLASFDRRELTEALARWSRTQAPETYVRHAPAADVWAAPTARIGRKGGGKEGGERVTLADDLLWMVLVVGTIAWGRDLTAAQAEALAEEKRIDLDDQGRLAPLPWAPGDPNQDPRTIDLAPIVDAACDLLECDLKVAQSPHPSLWLINRNRPAELAVAESRRAIKADAATLLFEVSCAKLTWAVIDSGIDASHPAFFRPPPREEEARAKEESLAWPKRTRVVKTYDFTRLRPLLDQEAVRELLNAEEVAKQRYGDPRLDTPLQPFRDLIAAEDAAAAAKGDDREQGPLRTQLHSLKRRLEKGREIDWGQLGPLLEIAHEGSSYPVPTNLHGTHVAGILAADWKDGDIRGICPDLRLYDLRVLDPRGANDEFTVLAALQFVQHLNLQKETPILQGANLSLSIRHEVTNYACGRTPVCEECERLAASGVVVVAAAGNAGWDSELARAAPGAGYRTLSITDPGNAEAAITVGATHRDKPHTYGVSFFSSRGPTGDGRAKPDLVAPGEKITSTIPGGRSKREDGTSMAAPHVSGAAALLMARHQELIGRPQRIKEILCRTATDLGRERQFQGAGMLDVLRALQSV